MSLRRGMTFLEVILSIVLLTMVTGMIMTAINGVISNQTRQHQRLAAAEVANRLMLQYIDDPESMPARNAPVKHGRDLFRWEVVEKGVTLTPAKAVDSSTPRAANALTANRLKTVQLNVWLSEESGGSYAPTNIVPAFSITRIVDPIFGQLRNPDTADSIMKDPVKRQRFLDAVTSMANNAGSRPIGNGKTTPPGGALPNQPGTKPGSRTPPARGGGKQ
ncbi:MAG: type II secretion system protein [Planctomycetes bacterium]|nr:type II secretion system protein [Planctomycetota bacterium]